MSLISANSDTTEHIELPRMPPSEDSDTTDRAVTGESSGKLRRAKASCLTCRVRKTKCGAVPHVTCAYCRRHNIPCEWPPEDLRKTRRRRSEQRSRQARNVERSSSSPQREEVSDVQSQALDQTLGIIPRSESSNALWTTSNIDPSISIDNWLHFAGESTDMLWNAGWQSFDFGNITPAQALSTLPGAPIVPGTVRFIKWQRPHGRTAFSPGITSLYLKVQIEPGGRSIELQGLESVASSPNDTAILRGLITTFSEYYGSQYPFLQPQLLNDLLDTHGEDSFLLNCVAAMSAGHSNDPRVVQPGAQPYEYGVSWFRKAQSMVGTVMAIPLRETIMGFVLLAALAVKLGSASEIWMFTGNAARMAYDLGLHLDLGSEPNRLVFWNVLMLDHIVSLGLGRPTTFRLEQVSQLLPEQNVYGTAARLMFAHGQLINQLNMEDTMSETRRQEVTRAKASVMSCYNNLPPDMQWSAATYRRHNAAGLGPVFLEMHLWAVMLLALASRYEASDSDDDLARSGAISIADMIDIAEAVNPSSLLVLPFIGQPMYHAACILIEEAEKLRSEHTLDTILLAHTDQEVEFSRSFRLSVIDSKVRSIQHVLKDMGSHWVGVSSIATALSERLSGKKRPALDTDASQVPAYRVNEWALPTRYRQDGASVN